MSVIHYLYCNKTHVAYAFLLPPLDFVFLSLDKDESVCSLIQQYLLSDCYLLDIVFGARDVVDKRGVPALINRIFWQQGEDYIIMVQGLAF